MSTPRYLQVDDYEPVAKAKLDADVYDYFAGGAGDERTLEENLRAFDRWVIRPRVLRGSASPDTSTEILGTPVASPVLVAPWAYQGRAHPDGERATVRGAARAGTIAVVSSTAVDDLEGIASASDGPSGGSCTCSQSPSDRWTCSRGSSRRATRRSVGPWTSPWPACDIATRGAGS